MDAADLLTDLFGRVREHVHEAIDGLEVDMLTTAPTAGTNPIAWLVWHLTRVEDAHVAELLGQDQVWNDAWAARFSSSADPGNHGYGHTWAEVMAIRPDSADALRDYHAAVASRTESYLRGVDAAALDRIIDESYDPPVTVGVRLVSIADDEIQHAGQAVYARGILERTR